jgi:hypothetical protein
MTHNLSKTGTIGFTDSLKLGQRIQTNFKVMQAIKAQHPTHMIDWSDRRLRYEKGELGIYTFWYE